MTQYDTYTDGVVTDLPMTHGILSKEALEGEEPDWFTAVNPKLLRDLADLIEFCYGTDDCIEIGRLDAWEGKSELPALAVGHMEADRWLALSPRRDTDLTNDSDECHEITEWSE